MTLWLPINRLLFLLSVKVHKNRDGLALGIAAEVENNTKYFNRELKRNHQSIYLNQSNYREIDIGAIILMTFQAS